MTLNQILVALTPVVPFVLTAAAKRLNGWNATKADDSATAKIRATAAVCAALHVVLLGVTGSNVTPDDLSGLMGALISFGAAWGGSDLIHQLISWARERIGRGKI